MSDRTFTHPNFGKEVRLEQYGNEVHLILVAASRKQSDNMVEELLRQIKGGAVNFTLMGTPTSIEDNRPPRPL